MLTLDRRMTPPPPPTEKLKKVYLYGWPFCYFFRPIEGFFLLVEVFCYFLLHIGVFLLLFLPYGGLFATIFSLWFIGLFLLPFWEALFFLGGGAFFLGLPRPPPSTKFFAGTQVWETNILHYIL